MNKYSIVRKLGIFDTILILTFCLLCFTTCASKPYARGRQQANERLGVYLINNSRYLLLPANGIEKSMDMAQYVSASFEGSDYYFIAWIRADNNGMEMTLWNDLGSSMGELIYSGGVVSFSSGVFPETLRGEYLVADFQLCFYKSALLSGALANCGLVLQVEGTKRRILDGEKLIIEIERGGSEVKLVNHLRGYSYTLQGDFE